MLNFFLFIKKFFKARWVLQKPKQKKFIVYDFVNSNVIFKYIKKTQSAIYYTRWEEINFFILFYIIFNYGLKDIKKNYKKFFFIFVNPKIAITSTSNQVSFYKLKNHFPNITTISIQNNLGDEDFIKLLKNEKKNSLSCDYFFFFSDSFRRMYEKYILVKKKSLIIGSFKNNFYYKKSSNNKKLLFISKSNWNTKGFLNEIILLNYIIKFLKKNQTGKIDICLKTDDLFIINHYKKNLDLKFINIIPKKNNYLSSYDYETIIFTDSTLGYECLAKGKKIISFALGSLKKDWCIKNNILPLNKFGYPYELKNEGFCWSNSCSEKKVNKLLKNIIFMKQSLFNKKIKNFKNKIMFFDPKNSKFKRLLCVV